MSSIEIHCGEYSSAKTHLDECLSGCARYGFAHVAKMTNDTLGVYHLAMGDHELGVGLIAEAANDPAFQEDFFDRPMQLCHLGTAWRRHGELDIAALYYQRALACPGIEDYPTIYLNCVANAEFTLAMIRGRSTRSLERAGDSARALSLGFVDLKIQFFRAMLERNYKQTSDAEKRLAAIVPTQYGLGHVSFLSQELALDGALVASLLTQDQPGVEDAVIDALARHFQAADILEAPMAVSERVGLKCLDAAKAQCNEAAQQRILARARRSKFAAVRRLALQAKSRETARATGVPGFPELTRREHEVLARIADGMTNPELASHLCLSPPTVKTHVNHIFSKLGVRNRVGAVIAFRERIEAQSTQGDGDLL
jgi:DNA-binding NarL/FixJ family response regulator